LVEAAFAVYKTLPGKFPAPFSLGEALGHRDKDGRTALALSVDCSQPWVQALLLEFKAAPDVADTQGNTALMLGAARGDRLAVERLIEAEANTETRNKAGKRALEMASQSRLRAMLQADLDRKLVAQRLAKSASLPALSATVDDMQSTPAPPTKTRPQLPEGQRRFRVDGLRGDRLIVEARIRTIFRRGCGAKLMGVNVGLDPITEACKGFAHVDLAFAGKRSNLALDRAEVETLLGDRVRVVEEPQA